MADVTVNKTIAVGVRIFAGICAFCLATTLFANPVVNNVASGNVSIQQTPNTTIINQSSQKAIINWQSFNINKSEATHFQQPAGGMTLNRINPASGVSEIYGELTATGRIILVNPAGIYFGPGSSVNVGGLIASTANISDHDFLNAYYHFTKVPGFNGAIVNEGRIIAAEHGLVALMGGAVRNDGMISAKLGHAVLASGDAFSMTFAGDDLVSFAIDSGITKRAVDRNGNEIADGVNNTGKIVADGGHVLMTASAAAGVLDRAVNTQGLVRVQSVSRSSGGSIDFSASTGSGVVRIAGRVNASGRSAGRKGGNITVTGDDILLDSTAVLDVSGSSGGGNVNIGGNSHGQGPLTNANAVAMLPGAKIIADATLNGNGGNVVLWSDNYTNVSGSISARGGSVSGNGGSIETSSKNILNVGDLAVDTSATRGQAGSWLLDPANLTITTNDANVTASSPFQPTATGATLNVTTLTSALASGNVTVQTNNDAFAGSGNITISSAITWTSTNTLLLQAFNDIIINAAISGVNGSLNLSAINAASSITTGANGTINVKNFNLLQGQWNQVSTTLPAFTVTNNFQLHSGSGANSVVQFIRATSGSGTSVSPYVINDVYGLQGIGSDNTTLTQYFTLGANIDATSTSTWNSGAGFVPISLTGNNYSGKFNGNSYAIDGLTINRSGTNAIGLFSQMTSAANISNVALTNVNIVGGQDTGGIVAINNSGTLSSVSAQGTIRGTNYVGGLIGYMFGGTLNGASFFTGTVTGSGTEIGGLLGYNNGTVSAASLGGIYASGTVTGTSASNQLVGGLTGYNDSSGVLNNVSVSETINAPHYNFVGGVASQSNGSITNATVSGDITGASLVGGITGYNNGTISGSSYTSGNLVASGNYAGGLAAQSNNTITNSSVGANVSGTSIVGGLVGYSNSNITGNSHMTGNVTASGSYVGGLVGQNNATISAASQGQIYSSGTVTETGSSGSIIGGLVGYNNNAAVLTNVSSSSNVYVPFASYVGGLVGQNNGTMTNAYATGNVTGASFVGGLVGFFRSVSLSGNSYATGTVTGSGTAIGGLIGENEGTISAASPGQIYATGTVTGTGTSQTAIGGLVGYNESTGVLNNVEASNTVNASNYNYVGGLVGQNHGGSINNSYAATAVTGQEYVGGAIGYDDLTSSIITNIHATGNVSGSSNYVGGLVGFLTNSLTAAYATGNVTASGFDVGGLVGWNAAGVISNSHATGNVSALSNNVGGLVGGNQGIISTTNPGDIYATGNVIGAVSDIGGLIGENLATISVTNAGNIYATGTVTETNYGGYIGGLIGANSGAITITNSTSKVYATGYVTAFGNDVGGLVGYNNAAISAPAQGAIYSTSTITDALAAGQVIGGLVGYNDTLGSLTNVSASNVINTLNHTFVGGLVGINNLGTITDSYSSSTVIGGSYTGGLVGDNMGVITATTPGLSYASGNVTGIDVVGGIVGFNNGGSVNNTYYAGVVTGTSRVGAFIGVEQNGATYTNDSIGNVTLNGNPGNNYFSLYVNQINGVVQVNGTAHGNTTFDLSGYSNDLTATMTNSENNGKITVNGILISNYNNIDRLIGNAANNNTLIPTTQAYLYLVRTDSRNGYFTDPFAYNNFNVPEFISPSIFGTALSISNFAHPISSISDGTYKSNIAASNVSNTLIATSPQWLIVGNQEFTIINNVERPVMVQSGNMDTAGMSPSMLPVSPYRSLTVEIINDLIKTQSASLYR